METKIFVRCEICNNEVGMYYYLSHLSTMKHNNNIRKRIKQIKKGLQYYNNNREKVKVAKSHKK